MADLTKLEAKLNSPNKDVRLKALKLILGHPDVSALQLVQCLCSPDNRNFEFMKVYDLASAMRKAWLRLSGVDDDTVYSFLLGFFHQSPEENRQLVEYILEKINTQHSRELMDNIGSE